MTGTDHISEDVIAWLLDGDPAIRWQVKRDLLGAPADEVAEERARVAAEGWGADLLSRQDPEGTWGGGMYGPKWISTTYTMILLRRCGLPQDHPQAQRACELFLERGFYHDGGINYFPSMDYGETCVTGMTLALLAYFRYEDERVHAIADHLIRQQMADDGWNCDSYKGATHSSFHTTISVLEGLREYEKFAPENLDAIKAAQARAHEFLLAHRLYKSDKTGEVVKATMTRFSFPPRWWYDVLRGLDYFQEINAPRDERMQDAVDVVYKRRKKDGRWVLQNKHSGRIFFEMEKVRDPSRWNTLRALRVLNWWELKGKV